MPPPGTIMCTCGWCVIAEPQVCSAEVTPIRAPRMLLYSLFNSVRDSLLALSGIPFAACGGILGLYVFGLNASVSAAVGFISLFGVSAMDGILLVSYIRRAMDEGLGKEEAIIQAAQTRMRQIFMTGFSACIGLVPAALSTGIGSQVQQPLACVIVGGMLLSPICSLLVIPTFARLLMPGVRKSLPARRPRAPEPGPAE
jgi:cobalt-zinc-cadmium resistance protein CzcA